MKRKRMRVAPVIYDVVWHNPRGLFVLDTQGVLLCLADFFSLSLRLSARPAERKRVKICAHLKDFRLCSHGEKRPTRRDLSLSVCLSCDITLLFAAGSSLEGGDAWKMLQKQPRAYLFFVPDWLPMRYAPHSDRATNINNRWVLTIEDEPFNIN